MAAKKQAASKASDSPEPEASTCAVDGCDRDVEYVPGLCKAHYDTHRGLARKPAKDDED
jgi:hypothetical protein